MGCSLGGLQSNATHMSRVLVCVLTVAVLQGCGTSSVHTVNAHLSVGTAYDSHGFVKCMDRNGMTVLKDGELQVPRTIRGDQLEAAEKICGLGRVTSTMAPGGKLDEASSERKMQTSILKTIAFRRLEKSVERCLRRHGVHALPEMDVGAVDNGDGINAHNPLTNAVVSKCRAELLAYPR